MRRRWFLLGLSTGLVISLHPVFDAVRNGITLLAEADARVREAARVQARADRIAALDHTPVGWGETIDPDGTETAPMQERGGPR